MQEKEKENKKVLKEFALTTLSVKNRTTVFVIFVAILVGGLISYIDMPREAFPEIVIPQIYVGTAYPGNSPEDIEKLITRPLEKEINTISGIDKMTSTSVQGYSTIFIEFDFSISPEEALRKVKDKVDIAKADSDFPTDLPADPNIFEMNFSELTPVMNINISGDYPIDQLEDYAEYLEDAIEELPEINEVDIRGVQEKEMKVNVDVHKMEANELSFNDVANAIASENMTISGGEVLLDNLRRTVRVVGDFENAKQIEDVIVKNEKFNIVYLRDIAEVVFEDKEKESYAREYQQPVVMVDVKKRAGENLINASDSIKSILADAKENVFPSDLEITITGDQSRQTRTQVGELENSIIFGMLLVVLVLLFFLGLRNAAFVGMAIPLSMFMAIMILSFMGITLNMMVLFSLVLALGMLVDNGIVVVENIYRLMDEGFPPVKAARYGVGEVAWPIIASTATTLAAFVPLALWPGMMGEFMGYLPLTLMIVLGSSLFVALVINPVFAAVLMKVEEKPSNKKRVLIIWSAIMIFGIVLYLAGSAGEGEVGLRAVGNLMLFVGVLALVQVFLLAPATKFFQGRVIPKMESAYRRFLSFLLSNRRPVYMLLGTFGMLIFSIALLRISAPKVLFFPNSMPNYLNVFIEAPIGTDIEEVNDLTQDLEAKVLAYASTYNDTIVDERGLTHVNNPLIESIIAQVGQGTSDPNQGPSMEATPHKARIMISFTGFQDRPFNSDGSRVNTNDVLDEFRDIIKGVPGARIVVDKEQAGPPVGKPINIEVAGDDYYQLLSQAEDVKTYIDQRQIPGIEELKLDVDVGKPEMPIVIDREKARRLNLSTQQIGMALRNTLFGLEVPGSFKDGEDDYKIMVRLNDEYRYNVDALMNQKLTFRDQMTGAIRQVPISAVARAERSSTFSAVKRKDQKRIITVMSNVLEGYNANEVVAEIKGVMEDYEMPKDNTIKFTGQMEEQEKEMSFLFGALLIAVFLIFLIMVAQFNSASTPFIIITSVIFSLIGVFLGLVIFQMDFVIIMTMIGIISLAGIVVNNAIVLIDYTNLMILRRKGELGLEETDRLPMDDLIDCVVEGGRTRLRPVLLTATTTVLGLFPLAIGLNIDFIGLITDYSPSIYVGGDNVIFWGPMSWAVIFGLTFATFLTLVMVPVMFLLMNKLKYRIFGYKAPEPVIEEVEVPTLKGEATSI